MKNQKIIIVSGLSGSGKSTALAAFEDAGFYCVDNMPVVLLPHFLKLPIESESDIAGLAFVMDLREKSFLSGYRKVFDAVKKQGHAITIIHMEADEQVLLQRYSQTRRHHPVAPGPSLLEGIRTERLLLEDFKKSSDSVIDTSGYNVHELKTIILSVAQKMTSLSPMRINIMSFGFKFGIR